MDGDRGRQLPSVHVGRVLSISATGPCVLDLTTNCVCSSNFAAAGACAATSTTNGQYAHYPCKPTLAQPVVYHSLPLSTCRWCDHWDVEQKGGFKVCFTSHYGCTASTALNYRAYAVTDDG